MDCSKLTEGLIAAECGTLAKAGAEDEVILINYSDIDRTLSTVENNVITDLVLKENAVAYTFTTFGKSLNDSGATFTRGTYRNTWVHTIALRIFTKNEDAKKYVNSLGEDAKIVCILKNNETGASGDVKYEAYGFDNGLRLNESASTIAMADGVVYPLTVSSLDEAQEGSLPKSVFKTDEETTDSLIESLTA